MVRGRRRLLQESPSMGYVIGMFAVVSAIAVGLLGVFAFFSEPKAPKQGH